MKAPVTGATGLIGKHLVPRLTAPRVLARDPERARRELGTAEAPRMGCRTNGTRRGYRLQEERSGHIIDVPAPSLSARLEPETPPAASS